MSQYNKPSSFLYMQDIRYWLCTTIVDCLGQLVSPTIYGTRDNLTSDGTGNQFCACDLPHYTGDKPSACGMPVA